MHVLFRAICWASSLCERMFHNKSVCVYVLFCAICWKRSLCERMFHNMNVCVYVLIRAVCWACSLCERMFSYHECMCICFDMWYACSLLLI